MPSRRWQHEAGGETGLEHIGLRAVHPRNKFRRQRTASERPSLNAVRRRLPAGPGTAREGGQSVAAASAAAGTAEPLAVVVLQPDTAHHATAACGSLCSSQGRTTPTRHVCRRHGPAFRRPPRQPALPGGRSAPPPAALARATAARCLTLPVCGLLSSCVPCGGADVEQALEADLGFDKEFERFKAAAAQVRGRHVLGHPATHRGAATCASAA